MVLSHKLSPTLLLSPLFLFFYTSNTCSYSLPRTSNPPAIMSSMVGSESDWLSDLLCREGDGILNRDLPAYSSCIELPADIEELTAGLIEDEGDYMPQSQLTDASARNDSVAWILKVYQFYHFQPLTAYLSISYMDRFLSSPCLPRLPQANGWLMQLISVACLSLAAKMEEQLVPSLLDIQVEGAKFIFEPRTIQRMELLVLSALDWRLRAITPFDFISFFATKVDSTGAFTRFLVPRAAEIILIIIRDINYLDYRPSSIAASAILCAADEFPSLSPSDPAKAAMWCIGLDKEKVIGCYKLLQEVVVDNCPRTPPKEVPHHRSANSDLSSASPPSSPSNKRRKLNNWLWEDEDKD